MSSTIYNRYAMIADPTPTVALSTPAFAVLPWGSGTQVQVKTTSITSPVIMPNGASAGNSNGSYWVEGTHSGQLMQDPTIDMALRSLLMTSDTSNVMVPGTTARPFAIQKSFKEGATEYFRAARGNEATKTDIKWSADAIVDYSSDFIGMSATSGATAITGATYADPSTTKKLMGVDVVLTLGGGLVATRLVKGSISIDMGRAAQKNCGTVFANGISVSSQRKVEYSFTFNRTDFTFDTTLFGTVPISVAVAIGTVGDGYRFDSASVVFDSPQDEDDDMGNMVTITGVAGYNATAGADVKITKL